MNYFWNFKIKLPYKTALYYARYSKEITELLQERMKTESKENKKNQETKETMVSYSSDEFEIPLEDEKESSESEQSKATTSQLETENEQLKANIRQLESDKEQLKDEIQKLETKTQQINDEKNQLKSYLFALKEKVTDVQFIDFNDYREKSEIGSGATSSVKIVYKKAHEKFAKKELKEFDHKSFKRFLKEGEILFNLRHPCIIRIYGINLGDRQHRPSILLSLEPDSLENAINNKTLNKAQKNRITVEIVLGMRYIHSRSFMHRDLKPLNILLSKNLHVRISDFGLAKEEDVSVSQSKGVGTLRFMAPEIFEENENGISYTNKVDVYSFGITLIFIVSDEYPKFNLKKSLNGVIPELPETIVGWVHDLIVSCLSPEPDERPSFDEIFRIMKSNNYDLFAEKSSKLSSKQKKMINEIEKRILKIEAFEYQHHGDESNQSNE